MRALAFATALLLAVAVFSGCHTSTVLGQGKPDLQLTSPSFANGEIPKKFTCDGDDTSPQLEWVAPPAATQSFALTIVDHDAPIGSFVHWVLYDVPPETRGLPEGGPNKTNCRMARAKAKTISTRSATVARARQEAPRIATRFRSTRSTRN